MSHWWCLDASTLRTCGSIPSIPHHRMSTRPSSPENVSSPSSPSGPFESFESSDGASSYRRDAGTADVDQLGWCQRGSVWGSIGSMEWYRFHCPFVPRPHPLPGAHQHRLFGLPLALCHQSSKCTGMVRQFGLN